MKTTAIIQVRMASTRLPGKAMLPLAGKPSIQHMIERVGYCKSVDEILIATTTDPADEVFANLSIDQKIPVSFFAGHPTNVMERITKAALYSETDIIVGLTADCPMIDPKHIDFLLDMHYLNPHCDVITNVWPRTWPDGLDILIFSREALKKVNKIVTDPVLRNHVGWNMLQYPDEFTHWNWAAPDLDLHWPELGLTLDELEDYRFLDMIFRKFYNSDEPFSAEEVIRWLRKDGHWIINANVRRKKPEEG